MRTIPSLSTTGRLGPPQTVRRADWSRLLAVSLARVAAILREWRQRSRDRAQLAVLDERMLRDIGISRGDVLGEINKPFWRK
jgi:uncharacterized protein YjiS (DUF1127 family)